MTTGSGISSSETPPIKFMMTMIFCALISLIVQVIGHPNSTKPNPLISNWSDQELIRERMEGYAREKFSHNYHHHSKNDYEIVVEEKNAPASLEESHQGRFRRDGGIISGPIGLAVLSGIIGMTSRAVSDLTSFRSLPSSGGCEWFGTAPLCNQHCPSDFDLIRKHNGRCSSFWFAGRCVPDDSFGEPCSTILGSYFTKRFCCKSDPNECTWSGRWMGADTAHNIYCRYDNSVGRCGELSCSINHYDAKGADRAAINGGRCDELRLFNATGRATCGYIAWFDDDDQLVNSCSRMSQSANGSAANGVTRLQNPSSTLQNGGS